VFMPTKTIPAYLEDERIKQADDQKRIEEEAARILSLHHGHHRAAKQPKVELKSSVKAFVNQRKSSKVHREKPHATHETVTKARKMT
jgi:hypothetical protein